MTGDLRADWRSLAGLDRLTHDRSRLMILTVLYQVAEADFLYLKKWGFTGGESFESSCDAGKGGECGGEEVVQGQLSDDGL
jgi:hypothetical protein